MWKIVKDLQQAQKGNSYKFYKSQELQVETRLDVHLGEILLERG